MRQVFRFTFYCLATLDKLARLKGDIDLSLQKAVAGITSTSTAPLEKPATVKIVNMVNPGYTGYNKELNIMANTHAFIRLSTLISHIEGWQSTRANIMTHLSIVLDAVSKLGERNFFSRSKRFGTHTHDGDEIFCDLGSEAMSSLLSRLIVSLQSARGEGLLTRNAKRGTTPGVNQTEGEEQGQTDQTLAISNALSELMNHVLTKDYTMNNCYTQDSFEAKFNLTWAGTS